MGIKVQVLASVLLLAAAVEACCWGSTVCSFSSLRVRRSVWTSRIHHVTLPLLLGPNTGQGHSQLHAEARLESYTVCYACMGMHAPHYVLCALRCAGAEKEQWYAALQHAAAPTGHLAQAKLQYNEYCTAVRIHGHVPEPPLPSAGHASAVAQQAGKGTAKPNQDQPKQAPGKIAKPPPPPKPPKPVRADSKAKQQAAQKQANPQGKGESTCLFAGVVRH